VCESSRECSRENKNAELCRAGCWRARNHRAMVRAGSVSRGRPEARSCMTRWQKSPSSTPSEIRLELSGADEPKLLAAPKRMTRPRPRQSHVAAVRQLQQGSTKSCSDGLLGSYALRARLGGSEVMPPYDALNALVGPGPSLTILVLCARLCGCWRPGPAMSKSGPEWGTH